VQSEVIGKSAISFDLAVGIFDLVEFPAVKKRWKAGKPESLVEAVATGASTPYHRSSPGRCTVAPSLLGGSMTRRRTAFPVLAASALLAAVPLLTACGSAAHPGAAAVVDGKRITEAQLQGEV
jgi:hypothetical protein